MITKHPIEEALHKQITGRMSANAAVKKLNAIMPGDNEAAHGYADDVLLAFLEANGHKKVADAWREACNRVGFWYA